MAAGWCGRIGGSKMPCESCAVQFSVFKRKRACCECDRYYCSGCLRRGGGMCAPCRVLSARPSRDTIASLKVRDLQCFLQRQNVSTRGCVEKDELVRLCESHVNSTSYRRRGQRPGASPFSSFKGFTNNINDFINSAFDLRTTPAAQQQQAQQPPSSERGYSTGGCFNSAHAHGAEAPARPAAPTTSPPRRDPERFTTRPCGEPDIVIPVPDLSSSVSRSTSGETTRVDTADCFEVEDLDDAGWEFVNRPADPLPNDSAEILMTVTTEGGSRRTQSVPLPGTGAHVPRTDTHVERTDSDMGRTDTHVGRTDTDVGRTDTRAPDTDTLGVRSAPARASSELNLGPAAHDDAADNTDSASLQDEPISQHHTSTPKHISVEQFLDVSELSALSVKQLKELLTRHRVEYRGALERADLLHRATTLWHNHHKYSDDIENMPIEECCKICMAAPLECVLLECGHIAACTACSKQLAECPICRQYVVRAVRFFRS